MLNFGAFKFRQLRRVARWNIRLREHRIVGEVYEIVDGTIGDYIRDHGLIYAAAVSFYALVSLIPFLILFASATGFLLAWLGVGIGADSDKILSDIVVQLRRGIPYIQQEFEEDLERIVHNRTGLGVAGGTGLLLASSQVFRALEFAFARIFARRSEKHHAIVLPRSLIVSKLFFGGFIIALVFAFLLFEFVIAVLERITESLPPSIVDVLGLEIGGASVFSHGITGVAVVLGFTTLMKLFTKQRVQLRFALIGGVVFFLAWQGARFAYEVYISQWTDLGALYGGFATLMVIVLWVFYSSSLLLMVGEFVQTLQRRVLYGPKWPKGKAIAARQPEEVEADEERRDADLIEIDPVDLSRAIAGGILPPEDASDKPDVDDS